MDIDWEDLDELVKDVADLKYSLTKKLDQLENKDILLANKRIADLYDRVDYLHEKLNSFKDEFEQSRTELIEQIIRYQDRVEHLEFLVGTKGDQNHASEL